MPVDQNELENLLDSYLDRVVSAIFEQSQNNIDKNRTGDTGEMKFSANINRKFLEKEIVYPAPQSVWIEFGTDPHPVSEKGREKIAEWAVRKLKLSKKEAERAAWLIARKIKRKGMTAQPFLRPAVSEVIERGVRI